MKSWSMLGELCPFLKQRLRLQVIAMYIKTGHSWIHLFATAPYGWDSYIACCQATDIALTKCNYCVMRGSWISNLKSQPFPPHDIISLKLTSNFVRHICVNVVPKRTPRAVLYACPYIFEVNHWLPLPFSLLTPASLCFYNKHFLIWNIGRL